MSCSKAGRGTARQQRGLNIPNCSRICATQQLFGTPNSEARHKRTTRPARAPTVDWVMTQEGQTRGLKGSVSSVLDSRSHLVRITRSYGYAQGYGRWPFFDKPIPGSEAPDELTALSINGQQVLGIKNSCQLLSISLAIVSIRQPSFAPLSLLGVREGGSFKTTPPNFTNAFWRISSPPN